MISFAFGFAVGVVAGPWFLMRIWPRIVALWDDIGDRNDHD